MIGMSNGIHKFRIDVNKKGQRYEFAFIQNTRTLPAGRPTLADVGRTDFRLNYAAR